MITTFRVFIFLCFFLCLFSFLSFDGYYFYDDFSYSFYAHQIATGSYKIATPDIFAHRWGLLLPLATSYYFLGVSDISTVALPLIASLVSLFFLYLFTHYLSQNIQIIALLLGGLDFYTLFFSNKLYPDVMLTTLVLAAFWVLFHRSDTVFAAVGLVLLLFWGFLCKELLIYLFPFVGIVAVKDFKNKQNRKFWLSVFLSGGVCIVLYLLIYRVFTGDFWYRFSLIQNSHYTAAYSYYDKPFSYTIPRITYQPLVMFANTTLLITLAGSLVVIFSPKNAFKQTTDFQKYLLWLVSTVLLMFWLMTTHFGAYNPIGLFPRHILFLMPLAGLLSAYALHDIPYRGYPLASAGIYLLAGLYTYTSTGLKLAILYFFLAAWMLLNQFFYTFRKWYVAGLGVLLLLHPSYTILKSTETGYADEKKIVQTYLKNFPQQRIVFTDDKLLTGHLWYYGFQKPANIIFKDFTEFDTLAATQKICYALVNEHSVAYFRLIDVDIPGFVDNIPKHWTLVARSGKVTLYRIHYSSVSLVR